MEIITKIINGCEYQFINEYWETSNAWGHKTTLLKNGNEIENNKIRYYNRTWESYRFQTCMSGTVDKLIKKELEKFINMTKEYYNIKRLTSEKKEKIIQKFEEMKYIKEYRELENAIRTRHFEI